MSRRRRHRFLHLLLPAAILLALAWWVDLRAVGQSLMSLTADVLVVALLLATLDRFAMSYKWRHLVLAGGARFPYGTALRIHYQAAASGRVVPAPLAADVLRIWLSVRAGVPDGVAASSLVLEKLISVLVAILVALLGLVYLTGRLPADVAQGPLFALLGAAMALGLAGFVLLLLARVHGAGAHLYRRWSGNGAVWQRVGRFGAKVSQALLHYRARKRTLLVNGMLGLGEYALQLAKMLVLAVGLGIAIAPMTFVAIVAVVLFVRRILGSVESWGLGEGSAVVVLALLGVQPDLALALLLANFAVSTVAVLPGAVLFYTHPPYAPPAAGRSRADLETGREQGGVDVPRGVDRHGERSLVE